MFKKLLDWYYKPKQFEKSGKLYKFLGMNLINKYWLNGGSYWIRKKTISPVVKGKKDLRYLINSTKDLETAHLAGLLMYSSIGVLISWFAGSYSPIFIFGGMNYVINYLPIMSSRHNRARALSLVERLEKRK